MKETFFATDGKHCRKTQLVKIQRVLVMPKPSGYIYNITPVSKTQGLFWKREQIDCKSQRNRKFAVRLCLL